MAVKRDKKVKKLRGSKTHGGGSMKKRRGAGNRGGRGNAGSGKRSDTNKPTLWKSGRKLGKSGFKTYGNEKPSRNIDIKTIEFNIDGYVKKKLAKLENDIFNIDLTKIGYDKLLGTGKASNKMNITVKSASAKAVEKVKSAGGQVNTD